MNMNDHFLTKDLYLAGMLYGKNIPFVGINRSNGLCFFVFENHELCEKLQQQFFSGTVDVNARKFVDGLRVLKDLIFSNNQ